MDYPPNASIPVYNDHTVYVKALRIPKGINVQFKNDVYSKKESVKTTGTVQNNKNLIFMEDDSLNQKPKEEKKQSSPTTTNIQKEIKKESSPVNPQSSTNQTHQTNNDLFDIFNTKGNNSQPVSHETNQQMPKIDSTCNILIY